MKTCPKCGKTYSGRSAMSRIDKKDICPVCGTREAMEAAGIDPESQTYKSIIEAAEAAEKQNGKAQRGLNITGPVPLPADSKQIFRGKRTGRSI